ncbi:MAG: hypothetical protein A49_05660 [Methyloceanibacter sp.]|nr:MAG: hypothetical protein A49_05660 [Methyloceanibacter sp.]
MVDLERVRKQYRTAFHTHGRSNSAVLTPKGRYEIRYRHMLAGVDLQNKRVLDFGCGLANLLVYLKSLGLDCEYTGADLLDTFIADNRNFFPEEKFVVIESADDLLLEGKHYDVAVVCGVFNIMYSLDFDKNFDFVQKTLERIWSITDSILAVDFLSTLVDFKVDDAFHVAPTNTLEFAQSKLSRFVRLDHNYLPYEYCLTVRKDPHFAIPESSERPSNRREL